MSPATAILAPIMLALAADAGQPPSASTAEAPWRDAPMQVRVYDVRDLLARAPAFRSGGVPRPPAAGGGDAQVDAGRASRRSAARDELVQLIERCVMPEAWRSNGGPCTIVGHDDLIVVRAPDAVHRLIERPASAPRPARPVGAGKPRP